VDALLGETQREVLVERVQTTDVGQDHHALRRVAFSRGSEGCELVAVRSFEHDRFAGRSTAGDRWERRARS
jgi:hypothetical protein